MSAETAELLDWVERRDVVSRLFEHAHHAVIGQGIAVMAFLAAYGRLSRAHLEKLWQAGAEQHSSVRVVVYRSGSFLLSLSRLRSPLVHSPVSPVLLEFMEVFSKTF